MAEEKMGAYKRKGAAESKELSEDGPVIDENKQTAGPGRSSGYTQNFGPARVSGYTKGAAKINSIMGKGPAEGFFDTVKKVGRTGVDIAKSVGAQALDMISFDPTRSNLGSFGDIRSAHYNSKNTKETEQNILDRVENRSASGETYPVAGKISRAFNDTGYGGFFGGSEGRRTANSAGVFPGLEVNSPSGTSDRDTSKGINSLEYDAKPISPGMKGATKKK